MLFLKFDFSNITIRANVTGVTVAKSFLKNVVQKLREGKFGSFDLAPKWLLIYSLIFYLNLNVFYVNKFFCIVFL